MSGARERASEAGGEGWERGVRQRAVRALRKALAGSLGSCGSVTTSTSNVTDSVTLPPRFVQEEER